VLSFIRSSDARKRPATRTTRLRLEPLEERAVPAFVISEVLFNPPGPNPNEYVEIRATNGEFSTPGNFFLLQVEGRSGQDPGNVRAAFDLSNIALPGGTTNNFVWLLQGGNGYQAAGFVNSFAAGAVGTNGFIGIGASAFFPNGRFAADGGANGFEIGSSTTFMLVQTPTPLTAAQLLSGDFDPNNNGTLTLPAGFVVHDSIGILDGHAGDHAYAPVAFAQNGVGTTNTGSGPGFIVNIPFTPTYVERLGNRTGNTQNDWVAATISGAAPFFSLRQNFTAPDSFSGLPLNNIGSANLIETTPPSVSTVTNNAPANGLPLNGVVTYTITFTEAIDPATVVLNDFVNGASSNAAAWQILNATQSPTNRRVLNVQVRLTSNGNFQLRINPGAIADPAGNQFAQQFTDSQVVVVDTTPPTVTNIDDGDADNLVPVNQPVNYTITFSEPIDPASFTGADINNAGTASFTVGAITQVAGTNSFTVLVTPTSGGTLRLGVTTGSVTDLAGNPLAASAFNPDNDTLTVDATPPTVSSVVNGATHNPVAVNQPLSYTFSFSEPMNPASVVASDFANFAPGGAQFVVTGISPNPGNQVFLVTVVPITGGGLQLGILAGTATDTAGNALASNGADTVTLTVDATAPFVVSFTDNNANNAVKPGVAVTYTVTFSEPIDPATLSASDFVNAAASPAQFTASNLMQSSPTVFTVQITPSTEGSLLLSLPAGTLTDVAGNPLTPAAFASETITVDGTPPAVVSIDDSDADNIVTVGRTLTYTVTLSEMIDNASISAGVFTNAGTSTITIGTITQVTPGVLKVEVTPTTPGTLQLQVNAGTLADLAGNKQTVDGLDDDTLSIRAAVPDTTPPEVVSITSNTGGLAFPNSTVTYTIVFDEAVNGAAVSAASFTNAGSAPIAVLSIAQPAANVLTVQVRPAAVGTLVLTLPAGAVSDVAGNPTAIAFSDSTAVNVVTPPGFAATVAFVRQLGSRARLGSGDINGDGIADILIGFNRTLVVVDGVSFQPMLVIPNAAGSGANARITQVFAVDVTHDGRPEIFVLTDTQARIFAPTGQFLAAVPKRLLPALLHALLG
jgi:Bacterial Ig-like domain